MKKVSYRHNKWPLKQKKERYINKYKTNQQNRNQHPSKTNADDGDTIDPANMERRRERIVFISNGSNDWGVAGNSTAGLSECEPTTMSTTTSSHWQQPIQRHVSNKLFPTLHHSIKLNDFLIYPLHLISILFTATAQSNIFQTFISLPQVGTII